jgi:NOL1/NOP2/fmu family ribosome biogenesis protein
MGLDPQYVFARVEPHGVSPNKDPRVAAWTTGADPDVDTSGFAVVYTPENVLGLADIPRSQMKPYYPRRRNTR